MTNRGYMGKKTGITLNLNMDNMSFKKGNVNNIKHDGEYDYVTRIVMVLPLIPNEIYPGDYRVEYVGRIIDIRLQVILNSQDDPILRYGKNFRLGTPGTGIPHLAFQFFTDNRGKYPCVLATLVFPYRLANWMDPGHEYGIRMDFDMEEEQVTGPPNLQDKVVALKVLNRLFRSEALKVAFKPITYDDVTVFREDYFRPPSKIPILTNLTCLASKTAYREAVEAYFLLGLDKQEIKKSVERLANIVNYSPIEEEADLLKIVELALFDVLAHHIENRRWVDAFWDGERKIKHEGEEITIPRQPKSEPEIQPTLHVILDIALSHLGIQVIRESDEGVGNIDFRFLVTTKTGLGISVGTEFKLAHHKGLRKGIKSQLPAYLRAIRSNSGIFSVMWFKDLYGKFFKEPTAYQKEQMVEWLRNEAKEVSDNRNITVIALLIDASIKPNASKIKGAA